MKWESKMDTYTLNVCFITGRLMVRLTLFDKYLYNLLYSWIDEYLADYTKLTNYNNKKIILRKLNYKNLQNYNTIGCIPVNYS